MSKLEDEFSFVRVTLSNNTTVRHPARDSLEYIAQAMQEASAILIRARHICQALTVHNGSMEASVVREIDAWRKKQGLER